MKVLTSSENQSNAMARRLKITIRSIAFLVILSLCVMWVQNIVTPNRDWPSTQWRMKKSMSGLFNEKPNSLDVLWVGTSHVAQGVSPMEIYRETGLHSHQICGPEQRIAAQYYLIKEVLKRQTPRVIAIDASSFFYSEKQNKYQTRWQEAIDALPGSSVIARLEMAAEYAKLKDEGIFDGDYLEMAVLPILKYHTGYKATQEEFLDLHLGQLYHRKGYVATSTVRAANVKNSEKIEAQFVEDEDGLEDQASADEDQEDAYQTDEQLKESLAVNRPYIERTVDMCRSKGIEVLLFKVPVHTLDSYRGHWSATKHSFVQALADECGVPFLDLNYEDTGIDWSCHSSDGGKHLNVNGAITISRFLSAWLLKNYEFDERSDQDNKAKWDEQLALYDWEMQYYKRCLTYNVSNYLDMIDDEGFTLLIRNSSPVGEWWTVELNDKLSKITGCDLDIGNKKAASLALQSAGNEVIAISSKKSEAKLTGQLEDGTPFSIDCGSGKEGSKGWIEVGDKKVEKDDGIQIIVYDNGLHCVVDSVLITGNGEKARLKRSIGGFKSQFRLRDMEHVYEVMAAL